MSSSADPPPPSAAAGERHDNLLEFAEWIRQWGKSQFEELLEVGLTPYQAMLIMLVCIFYFGSIVIWLMPQVLRYLLIFGSLMCGLAFLCSDNYNTFRRHQITSIWICCLMLFEMATLFAMVMQS